MTGEDEGLQEYLGTEEAEHERGLMVYFQKELDKLPPWITRLVLVGVLEDQDGSPAGLSLSLEISGDPGSVGPSTDAYEAFLDLEARFREEIRNYFIAFPVDDEISFTRKAT